MGAFIGGEIYVLCCIGCAKSSEDVASTRRKVVGWRQGLCAEYKKCLNSTARVYLIGGPARMPGIHRKERENRKRKTHLTHTGLLMEGVAANVAMTNVGRANGEFKPENYPVKGGPNGFSSRSLGVAPCSSFRSAWLASSLQIKLWPSCNLCSSSFTRNHLTMSGLGPSPTVYVSRTTTSRLRIGSYRSALTISSRIDLEREWRPGAGFEPARP